MAFRFCFNQLLLTKLSYMQCYKSRENGIFRDALLKMSRHFLKLFLKKILRFAKKIRLNFPLSTVVFFSQQKNFHKLFKQFPGYFLRFINIPSFAGRKYLQFKKKS
jgi:hypothetical protein